MAEWSAEIEVDEALARELIGEQFPSLELGSLVLVSQGWDNTVWLVDREWAFRFPRREIAVPLVERELATLPRIATRLPVPIPVPVFEGAPSPEYPWPFTGSRFLPGSELGSTTLTSEEELEVADTLGRFLRELHSPEIAQRVATVALPVDPNSRADMSVRVPRTRQALAEVEKLGLWERPPAVEPLLEEAATLPAVTASALVHGDLHFRHVLIEDGAPTGIIDWGDVCLADPSVDLQLVWSYFSPPAREAFLRAYGPIPEQRFLRARVFALFISARLASYGHGESLAEVEHAALSGLEHALV